MGTRLWVGMCTLSFSHVDGSSESMPSRTQMSFVNSAAYSRVKASFTMR